MTVFDILDKLQRVKKTGDSWIASCPCGQNHSHNDKEQSLSVSVDAETGKILLYCHVGCSFEEICTALGCKPSDLCGESVSPLPFAAWYAKMNDLQFVEIYNYCYGDYRDGLAKIRYKEKQGKKTFRWIKSAPEKKSGFQMTHNGCEHRLYLAGTFEDDTIILAEGEKDANSVHKVFGYTAVSAEDGATKGSSSGKWRQEYTEQLTGKTVYILADNDEAGQNFARIEAQALAGKVQAVYMTDLAAAWPECPEKGDVSDLIQTIGSEKAKDIFSDLLHDASLFVPSHETITEKSEPDNKKNGREYRDLVLDLIDAAKIRQFGRVLYRIVDGKYYKVLGDIFINHELIAVRGMEPEKQNAAQTMIKALQKDEYIRYDAYYVGFKNGIMNWRAKEFIPYGTADIPIFRYFDVNYNPPKWYLLQSL